LGRERTDRLAVASDKAHLVTGILSKGDGVRLRRLKREHRVALVSDTETRVAQSNTTFGIR
jgi:hypothetical protein